MRDLAPCQKSVQLQVAREAIEPVRRAVLAEFQKGAALPGFRKGKAPTELVERQYAKTIQDEVLHRVMKHAFEQVAQEHQLKPVGPFEVTKADFSEPGGLTLEATVEVEPAFTLGPYTGIPLTREASDVTPPELDRALETLRGSMAQLVPATEPGTPPTGGVGEGSAEGRSPRPTEPGTPPTGGVGEGSAEGRSPRPTEPGNPPPWPADSSRQGRQAGGRGNPDAAGGGTTPPPKKERQLPALDEDFAKDLGFEDLSKLKSHVEAKLREQKRSASERRLEAALCDELLTRHPFDVPSKLVSRQTDRLARDFKVRLLLSGMPEDQIDPEVTKFTGELRTSAQRHVKLTFILDRIATQESVTVTQDELVGRLWQLAQRWKKDPAEVRKIFDQQGLWPSVVSAVRQEKTIARLLAAATITNGAASADQTKPTSV